MVALVIAAAPAAAAQVAGLDCSLQSARTATAPKPSGSASGFRIYWHVATQIEDIADANGNDVRDIKATQKLVDGYFFNVLIRGPLTYWPDRPEQCGVNKKLRTPEITRACNAERSKILDELGYSSETELQVASMERAVKVLGIPSEQAKGKAVMSEMLLNDEEMSYVPETDTIKLNSIPLSLCVLDTLAVTPNAFMVYQEPRAQIANGKFLWVPRKINGKLVKSKDPKADKIPENARVFQLLGDAFMRAAIPFDSVYPNLRAWNRRAPSLVSSLIEIPIIGGLSFEGGSGKMSENPRIVRQFAQGMSWTLRNSEEDIILLIPGYWTPEQTKTTDGIDQLPGRLREYILAINNRLSSELGSRNAICNPRIILIPASYGRPLHVKTLPSMRNGKYAGTVTGQIGLLNSMRQELCGS
jgi:hypothetical protein